MATFWPTIVVKRSNFKSLLVKTMHFNWRKMWNVFKRLVFLFCYCFHLATIFCFWLFPVKTKFVKTLKVWQNLENLKKTSWECWNCWKSWKFFRFSRKIRRDIGVQMRNKHDFNGAPQKTNSKKKRLKSTWQVNQWTTQFLYFPLNSRFSSFARG